MADKDVETWIPFRPDEDDLKRIGDEVAAVSDIQKTLVARHEDLRCPDRVAHQYQIAGSKVVLVVDESLPAPLHGVGLFEPRAEHVGVGRISTGVGSPHLETNPDFLGAMLAFQTKDRQRVDILAINDAAAPTDSHRDFIDVLHATGESAGAELPLVGRWGEYDVFNIVAEQKELAEALKNRMGWIKAGKTLAHLTKQSIRTVFSSTAYQTYWTGIEEIGGAAGKLTLVPTRDENAKPEFRPGERHLTEEWRRRQKEGDVEFLLYWIAYLDEARTPTKTLTDRWEEGHKERVGVVRFPRTDPDSGEARLWAILASEMGANPGNWVHDEANSIKEPATEFGVARKIAYRKSQEGRGALEPRWYESVFETGEIGPELARELKRRREEKDVAGHTSWSPSR